MVDEEQYAGTVLWAALRDEATDALKAVSANPSLDARRIIERAAGVEPRDFAAVLGEGVTNRQMMFYERMVARRQAGEPLQYVVGVWSFRTLDLLVDRRVLIPRPETEVVAEYALREYDRACAARGAKVGTAVDLGTGSGAIAWSIAAERPGANVWATDLSAAALDVARANLAGLGRAARSCTLVEGDWFDALPANSPARSMWWCRIPRTSQ